MFMLTLYMVKKHTCFYYSDNKYKTFYSTNTKNFFVSSISTQKTLINGTWKMNGNGNKITLSIQDVSAPMILTLVKINSTTMEIVDHFPNSDFQMLYKKH